MAIAIFQSGMITGLARKSALSTRIDFTIPDPHESNQSLAVASVGWPAFEKFDLKPTAEFPSTLFRKRPGRLAHRRVVREFFQYFKCRHPVRTENSIRLLNACTYQT